MKKILLSAIALVMSVAMWADVPTEYTLSFTATSSSSATVSVTNGASATVSCTQSIKNSGWGGRTACIVQDKNGNASANYTFTITLTGMDPAFTFDGIEADIYGFNGQGGSQQISTTTPGNIRCWNMIYKIDGNAFATNNNVDICMNATASTMTNSIIHGLRQAYATYPATFGPNAEGEMTLTLQCTSGSPNAGSFLGLGDIRLYTYDKRPIALQTLDDNITAAKANQQQYEDVYAGVIGERLGAYTITAGDYDTLVEDIATAEDFRDAINEDTTTQAIFDAADAVKVNMLSYKLNTPKEGDVFYLASTLAGKFVSFDEAGKAIALTTEPGENCILVYKNGSIVSFGTGLSHTNTNQVAAPDTTAETVTFSETIVAGNNGLGRVVIETNNAGNRFWQVTSDEATTVVPRDFGNFVQNEFEFHEVSIIPVSFVNEYTTFICPVNVFLGGDIEAYMATAVNSSSISFTQYEEMVLPANTPVLLKNINGEYQDFSLEVASEGEPYTGTNLLRGDVKRCLVSSGYILYKDQFWGISEEGYLAAHKAYVDVPPTVNALTIQFDGETGIEEIHNAEFIIHNNGKFLENGKIVIVKNNAKYNVAGQSIK